MVSTILIPLYGFHWLPMFQQISSQKLDKLYRSSRLLEIILKSILDRLAQVESLTQQGRRLVITYPEVF
jgi:hypothetical protein